MEIDGKPFTDFYMSGKAFNAEVTKPYLWPLRAASGTYITRAWPMEDVQEEAGEKKPQRNGPPTMDHQHQRGLWFAHDSVNKLDFWNNEWSYFADLHRKNLGRINLKKNAEVKSGKTQGSISATFEWTDMEGNNPHPHRISRDDFLLRPQTALFRRGHHPHGANTAVTFGDGKDGAFGIRLRPVLQEDKGVSHITNAEGLVGEKQLWGKPSPLVRLFRRDQRRKGRRRHPRSPR